jgi:DMSO/TMAO reductase YedYZ molybdopterin-dependent catalytic subunit
MSGVYVRVALVATVAFLVVTTAAAQSAVQCPAAAAGVVHVVGVPKPYTLTAADLAQWARAEVRTEGHGSPPATYAGVPLRAVLTRAGVAEGPAIRGKLVGTAIVVEALDAYRATFALAETDTAFTNRVILLADKVDGKPLTPEYGPYQLIVPGEKRHARWVRQVTCIRMVEM